MLQLPENAVKLQLPEIGESLSLHKNGIYSSVILYSSVLKPMNITLYLLVQESKNVWVIWFDLDWLHIFVGDMTYIHQLTEEPTNIGGFGNRTFSFFSLPRALYFIRLPALPSPHAAASSLLASPTPLARRAAHPPLPLRRSPAAAAS
jgi:hypothetical protein